ncbi:hypothetical protein [Streptantibioticus silvisoli]|uniref:UDP-glucuronosyltransferase n=1 Tax=Streptantibioticus silvisoli TaxID=2705255 RepID=A0ABT6VWF7_9ACTN|nr:hypothetical protein [Streptantibioticus silvisoli]MDI5962359.1 hypothetical protein [Streptantibioticus silvisoli]
MIAVLTSGVALGVHTPGLLLADRLRDRGVRAETLVLERLLPPERLRGIERSRGHFHRDIRFARAGQRIAADPTTAIPDEAAEELGRRWRRTGVETLVVFSGFWLPVLERALGTRADRPRVVICHVDSAVSPSFRRADLTAGGATQVWLASAEHGTVPWTIPVGGPPVPWTERPRRLLVHGGGWGMGTYRERAQELLEHGHAVDLVVHEPHDVPSQQRSGVRYFAMDPDWHPWHDDGYPPLAQVPAGWSGREPVRYTRGAGRHPSFDLAARAEAIVSKPGGGTLLDSLWSATPLVLLEPVGDHEARNAELWCALGHGITYEAWRATGFDRETLARLHRNLLRAVDGPRDLAAHLAGAGTGVPAGGRSGPC